MLSKDLLKALNEQMNHEYFAAQLIWQWLLIAIKESYEGFANFYIEQAKEERYHGKKSTTISTTVANMQYSIH